MKALITGVTGQDGSYLAEFLLSKGYEVYGIKRRSSSFNTGRIDPIFKDIHEKSKFKLLFGDMTDVSSLNRLIRYIKPDEIYNLAAQSHVQVSFEIPEYTADVTALGTLRLLEAIRESGVNTKLYQAGSSEMFGNSNTESQNEQTPFRPRSPYAISKVFAHWMTVNYREAYNMFTCNGILFNHESPRRGETFVTRKITRAVVRIKENVQDCLYLGNLDSKRDWGHAKDYVEAMWMMLQQKKPDDYVIATGESYSVREFLEKAFEKVGIKIKSNGKEGINEEYTRTDTGKVVVKVDPKYFRPTELNYLRGDSSKARKVLGWKPKIKFDELVEDMIKSDWNELKKELHGSLKHEN